MRSLSRGMIFVTCLSGIALAPLGHADESHLKLTADADTTLVMANCAVCHSVDYIQMNASFLQRAGWEAEVKKMIKVYGAPVADDDAARIVAYLTRHYGVE
jgi:Ni,Fe-hydrogenase I small subunit